MPNANPVVADADGRFGDIFLAASNYKVILKTSADVTVWTADPVLGTGASAAATETVAGIAEIATQAETNTGTDDTRIVTPLKLAAREANIKFPATQNPSADANTLDDYEEGTWTPVLTFVTPGNLNVVYSTQLGTYTKIGRLVQATFNIQTSTFTHTTASGDCTITGLPFSVGGGIVHVAALEWAGITKASYTNINFQPNNGLTTGLLGASGSGQVLSTVTAADMPTGGNVFLRCTIVYHT